LLETADESGGAFDRVTMAAINLAAAGFGSGPGARLAIGPSCRIGSSNAFAIPSQQMRTPDKASKLICSCG